ncbi:hypothetical protein V6N13_043387 [Hibiscus sabdariffa]
MVACGLPCTIAAAVKGPKASFSGDRIEWAGRDDRKFRIKYAYIVCIGVSYDSHEPIWKRIQQYRGLRRIWHHWRQSTMSCVSGMDRDQHYEWNGLCEGSARLGPFVRRCHMELIEASK